MALRILRSREFYSFLTRLPLKDDGANKKSASESADHGRDASQIVLQTNAAAMNIELLQHSYDSQARARAITILVKYWQ